MELFVEDDDNNEVMTQLFHIAQAKSSSSEDYSDQCLLIAHFCF